MSSLAVVPVRPPPAGGASGGVTRRAVGCSEAARGERRGLVLTARSLLEQGGGTAGHYFRGVRVGLGGGLAYLAVLTLRRCCGGRGPTGGRAAGVHAVRRRRGATGGRTNVSTLEGRAARG